MEHKSPLTPKEEKVMTSIVNAHNAFMELDITHTSEQGKWIEAIIGLQEILLMRNLRRQYPDYLTNSNTPQNG